VRSLETIGSIETSFRMLENDFSMPRNLDFTPPDSPLEPSTPTGSLKLEYTSANAPIHNYTPALTELLSQLDAIESHGSDQLRARRKEVVEIVERALENVENSVEHKRLLTKPKNLIPDSSVAEPAATVPSAVVDQPTVVPYAIETTPETPLVEPDLDVVNPPKESDATVDSENVTETALNTSAIGSALHTFSEADKQQGDADANLVDSLILDTSSTTARDELTSPSESTTRPAITGDEANASPPEVVDTFLLPSPSLPPSPPHIDEDLVVVETETWSEVEA
jgi:hypothetical protein